MSKIKGWTKKSNTYTTKSWLSNKRNDGRSDVVRVSFYNNVPNEVLISKVRGDSIKKFNTKKEALSYAMKYMRDNPKDLVKKNPASKKPTKKITPKWDFKNGQASITVNGVDVMISKEDKYYNMDVFDTNIEDPHEAYIGGENATGPKEFFEIVKDETNADLDNLKRIILKLKG